MSETTVSPARAVSAAQLDEAVARGVISPEQRAALLELAGASSSAREERSGVNLVTVGYWAGAVIVLFALAWFLIDRWKSLRPAGVLGVALLYATSFAMASRLLRRLGYSVAAGLLALLVVGMAPIVAWCLLALLQLWPEPVVRRDAFNVDVMASLRWIPVQLSMALAALVALRVVRFGMLALAVTIPMGLALVHLTPALFDPELNYRLSGWMTLAAAMLMFVAASTIDRRAGAETEDWAGWVYLSGAGFFLVGLMSVMGQTKLLSHLLPVIVALLVGLTLTLRRRVFLLPALILFITYLTFLAREVFPTAVGFMIVMIAIGALLIFITIAAQRRFPHVVRGLSGEGASRPASRRLGFGFAGLALLTVILTLVAIPPARRHLAGMQTRRNEMYRQEVERQRAAQRRGAITARKVEPDSNRPR